MSEQETIEIVDDPIEVRRNKRAALIEAGGNPYGHAFEVSAKAAELEERYADLEKELYEIYSRLYSGLFKRKPDRRKPFRSISEFLLQYADS